MICFGAGFDSCDKGGVFMTAFLNPNIEALVWIDHSMRGFQNFLYEVIVYGIGKKRWKMTPESVNQRKSDGPKLWAYLLPIEQHWLEEGPRVFDLVRKVSVSMSGGGQKFVAHIFLRKSGTRT